MGVLTEFVKNYFATTPEEQLRQDWEELKSYNAQGPDILDVIDNYGQHQPDFLVTKLDISENYINNRDDMELYQAA